MRFKEQVLLSNITQRFGEFTGNNKQPRKIKADLGNYFGSLIRFIEQNQFNQRKKVTVKDLETTRAVKRLKTMKEINMNTSF